MASASIRAQHVATVLRLSDWRLEEFGSYASETHHFGPFEDGRYPAKSHASRNFIKDDDLEWVRGTVVELLAQGAVSRWSDLAGELAAAGIEVTERPHLIMPLIAADKSNSTPEDRKRRLIHDCRMLNEN